jgi:uncharacterized phiE125 gp8 family phage protein
MGLSLVTAPVQEPLGREETKAHLRIDSSVSDNYVEKMIRTARAHVESVTRRRLVQQTWDYTLAEFPNGDILLPIMPVSSVTSVGYVDGAGATQAFTTYTVITDGPRARVVPDYNVSWPTTRLHGNAVTVRFVTGYEPTTDSPQDLAGNIPEDLKEAMALYIGTFHENRESSSPLAIVELPAAKALMSPYILRDF